MIRNSIWLLCLSNLLITFLVTWFPGYLVSWLPGFLVTWFPNFLVETKDPENPNVISNVWLRNTRLPLLVLGKKYQ